MPVRLLGVIIFLAAMLVWLVLLTSHVSAQAAPVAAGASPDWVCGPAMWPHYWIC